jgi:hydrogenase maturation protease
VPEDRICDDKKVLILGLGNDVLGDEGLGIYITEDLKNNRVFPQAEYKNTYTGGLNLLDYITGFDAVLIIDTTCGNDCQPGTIHQYSPRTFRETLHLSSEHDASFLTVLKTGKKLGFEIPGKVDIIAIEILRDLFLTEKFSDNISGQYYKIRSEIINFIKKIYDF